MISYRNYKYFNKQKFINDVSGNCTLEAKYQSNLDHNISYNDFQNSLETIINKHAPLKTR